MVTFKQKFNKKFNQPINQANSLNDIARLTKINKKILQQVFNRGIGAYKSSPSSVRSKSGEKKAGGFSPANRMSKEQWAIARVYGFVGNNPKQVGKGKPDNDLKLNRK